MSQKATPFELPTGEGAPKNWGLGVDVFMAIQRATLARCGQEPAVLFLPCFSMVSVQPKPPRRAYHFGTKCSKLHFTNKVLSRTMDRGRTIWGWS
ncbi:hypothetical protein AKG34_26335 [Peribacillus butanolivorans]|nr:hypothetical protein AKG34_26335 [Peribacillus butanolivorans]